MVEILGLKKPLPKIRKAKPVHKKAGAEAAPCGNEAQANMINCPQAIKSPPTKIDFLLPQYLSAT